MGPNQKVMSSTSAFFVIFGKYGRVLSTIDEFRTRLDWLQVSVMKTSCFFGVLQVSI